MRITFWATLLAFTAALIAIAFSTPEWSWQRKGVSAAVVPVLIVAINVLRQLNRAARRKRSDIQL